MAFSTWPILLPQAPLLADFQEISTSTTSSVTTGNKSILVRRNTTRSQDRLKVSFHFTREQVDIFNEFYYDVLGGGAKIFYFKHPRTLKIIMVSFDPTSEQGFQLTPLGSMNHYKVDATFLIWD